MKQPLENHTRYRDKNLNQLKPMGVFTRLSAIILCLILMSLLSHPKNTHATQNSSYQVFFPITASQINAYYVSLGGSDSNPGTLSQPWRTLSKAASRLQPGDRLYIRGGVYYESVDFFSSGTSAQPITIMAYPSEVPVIDGNNYTIPREPGGALIELSGDYIIISGLEVRYSSYQGVLLSGAHSIADNINANHNLHSGMRETGDYDVIKNSLVWSNDMQNYGGINPAGDSTGLTASRHPNYAILRNNKVFGNWGIGMSTYEANGTTLEGNVVYDNYSVNVYISDATNILFQNNFIYATGVMPSNDQVGIQLGDEVSNPPSSNITIINNIVYHTDRNLACWKGSTGKMLNVLIANNTFVNSVRESGVIFSDGLLFENVSFENNLVQQEGDLPVISLPDNHPGLVFSHNLWSKPSPASASGPGDVIGDPVLSHKGDQYSPPWFSLSSTSPAIEKALSLPQVVIDYFGNPREVPPDIGADEFFPSL